MVVVECATKEVADYLAKWQWRVPQGKAARRHIYRLVGGDPQQVYSQLKSTAPELSCMGSMLPVSVPVVLFPLVPNRAYNDVVADDLEENDVPRHSERDDQFPGSAVTKLGSTACIGRPRKQPHALPNSIQRSLRTGPVWCPTGDFALNGEILKAPEILYRFLQQRDRVLERHWPTR